MLREILLVIGFLSAVFGVSLINIPASLILGGTALIWLALPPKNKQGGK